MVKLSPIIFSLAALSGTTSADFSATSSQSVVVTAARSPSFLPHNHNKKIPSSTTTSSALDTTLSIRGGHHFEDAAKIAYYAVTGVHGAVCALAPEKTGKILYNGKFTVEDGSLSSMLLGYVGSTLIACMYMAMLAFGIDNSDHHMDAATIVAHGTYPCALMHLKNLLQGNFDRNGCGKGAAYAMTLSSIIIPLAIRSGKYDSNYLAWFNPIFYGLVGAAGTIDRNLGMKLMGHKEGINEEDGQTMALCGWMFDTCVQWSIIAISLLNGLEPAKAVGYSALFWMADLVNNNHFRKANAPLNLDDAPGYVMAALLAFISYAFLVEAGMEH